VADAIEAQVRLYEPLFVDEQPDTSGRDRMSGLHPESKKVVRAVLEPTLRDLRPEDRVQIERHGYFVADRADHEPGRPVLNRITALRDSSGK
jgi:glutaminyl-tRNA synthetase